MLLSNFLMIVNGLNSYTQYKLAYTIPRSKANAKAIAEQFP